LALTVMLVFAFAATASAAERDCGFMTVFVRFADQDEFLTPDYLELINTITNSEEPGALSVRNFYEQNSFGSVTTHHRFFPRDYDRNGNPVYYSFQFNRENDGNLAQYYSNLADTLPIKDRWYKRPYYMPYDALNNPTGYGAPSTATYYDNIASGTRRSRLLQSAILYIKAEKQLNYDDIRAFNFNNANNIAVSQMVVCGERGPWGALLWAHASSISVPTLASTHPNYSKIPNAGTNAFTPDNIKPAPSDGAVATRNYATAAYSMYLGDQFLALYDVNVFCHELWHNFGGPDLYPQADQHAFPVGFYDPMDAGYFDACPFHLVFMKRFKLSTNYSGWVVDNNIGTITNSGRYKVYAQADFERADITGSTASSPKMAQRITFPELFPLYDVTSKSAFTRNGTTNNGSISGITPIHEEFWVEYRIKEGFDSCIPDTGLVIYRADYIPAGNGFTSAVHNVNNNTGVGAGDQRRYMLYVFRPGGEQYQHSNPLGAAIDGTLQKSYGNPNPGMITNDNPLENCLFFQYTNVNTNAGTNANATIGHNIRNVNSQLVVDNLTFGQDPDGKRWCEFDVTYNNGPNVLRTNRNATTLADRYFDYIDFYFDQTLTGSDNTVRAGVQCYSIKEAALNKAAFDAMTQEQKAVWFDANMAALVTAGDAKLVPTRTVSRPYSSGDYTQNYKSLRVDLLNNNGQNMANNPDTYPPPDFFEGYLMVNIPANTVQGFHNAGNTRYLYALNELAHEAYCNIPEGKELVIPGGGWRVQLSPWVDNVIYIKSYNSTPPTLFWSTSNASVVDQVKPNDAIRSCIRGYSPGTATITAQTANKTGKFSFNVTVTNDDIPVKYINRGADPIFFNLTPGGSVQANPVIRNKYGDNLANDVAAGHVDAKYLETYWTTTDPTVVTVDAAGKITAVAPGHAFVIVTCKYTGYYVNYEIIVK
jgi:M6 family metalloprotease-like protein